MWGGFPSQHGHAGSWGCCSPELTDQHRTHTWSQTHFNDSPEPLPIFPRVLVLLSPALEPSLHTLKVQIFLQSFVCLLVFKQKTAKIQRLFSNWNILIFHRGKANPPTQVIATQSYPGLEFPVGFSSCRAERKDFPRGPANDPSIMWRPCGCIQGSQIWVSLSGCGVAAMNPY